MNTLLKKNCIFISVNKSFLDSLKVCLSSILNNYSQHPDIILCHTDLTKKDLEELFNITDKIIPLMNDLLPEDIGPIMDHLPLDTDPKVFYARFLLWRGGLFDDYKNILHLDADTIVMNDLDEFINQDKFYSVLESYQGYDKIFKDHNDPVLTENLKNDSIEIGKYASNAGVFLLPPQFRTQEHYQDIVSLLSSYRHHIKRADQSVLNIRMYKHKIPIQEDFKYNFQHRLLLDSRYDIMAERASIFHFNGVSDIYRSCCMQKFLSLSNQSDYLLKYRYYYNHLSY